MGDYPSRVRSVIASDWLTGKRDVASDSKENIVFSSIDEVIQKHKALQFGRQILFGKAAEYFSNYKIPDQVGLKYETPTQNRKLYNVGRNEPCPCGSGKKFKKCCGRE